MDKFHGVLGIILILGIAFLFSNNKRRINYRLVVSGMLLQVLIAVLVLKVPPVTWFFQKLGHGMEKIERFAREGVAFVYRGVMVNAPDGVKDFGQGGFVFAFSVTATIILVCVLVAILYHFGVMQFIVSIIAKAMNFIMRVSGAEALSNVASAFVGQVEAQVMIRPYLNAGALVISKIVFPETEESETMGKVKLEVKSPYSNIIDAISHGASDGMKIAVNVIAMLIGFIALIAFLNYILGLVYPGLSLDFIFSKIFYPMAWAMGVPSQDVANAATLLGQKLTINEFVAFNNLTTKAVPIVSEKGLLIVSIAICGFANFSSVGMQIGGIGELAPSRRADLAKLGLKALLCGTLASYLSASIAGILMG